MAGIRSTEARHAAQESAIAIKQARRVECGEKLTSLGVPYGALFFRTPSQCEEYVNDFGQKAVEVVASSQNIKRLEGRDTYEPCVDLVTKSNNISGIPTSSNPLAKKNYAALTPGIHTSCVRESWASFPSEKRTVTFTKVEGERPEAALAAKSAPKQR